MLPLCCPVCGGPLARQERTLRCESGHCYDLAKQNYVNLLMRNSSGDKRHGDDKRMVAARTEFLDAGWYVPLREALCALALAYASAEAEELHLLDVGCGEGYYTAGVRGALEAAGRPCSAAGIDISKTALMAAGRRDPALTLAVASVNRLPLAAESCHIVMNVFAPNDDAEFARVLVPGGVLLKAVPREKHLMGLKAAVYERPYENPAPDYAPGGFALLERRDVNARIRVSPRQQIENLFMMTPYYYKTGAADQAKLAALDELETELEFAVYALQKQP